MEYKKYILEQLRKDKQRMDALYIVKELHLPDWYIAAGFVRNLVWDALYQKCTVLNDIDVIYYCNEDVSVQRDRLLEKQLRVLLPSVNWSVKNQARMHIRNLDAKYSSSLDAMGFWPEKQTAVGVKLNHIDDLEIANVFCLSCLFNGKIERNPVKSITVFENRISTKNWLSIWPLR